MQALIDFSGIQNPESPPSEGSLCPECRYEVMIEMSTDAGGAARPWVPGPPRHALNYLSG